MVEIGGAAFFGPEGPTPNDLADPVAQGGMIPLFRLRFKFCWLNLADIHTGLDPAASAILWIFFALYRILEVR